MMVFIRYSILVSSFALTIVSLLNSISGIAYVTKIADARFAIQTYAAFVISAWSGIGVLISAIFPNLLVTHQIIRSGFVCAALSMPAIDVFAWKLGGLGGGLLGHLIASSIWSGLVALGIASAWLPVFKNSQIKNI